MEDIVTFEQAKKLNLMGFPQLENSQYYYGNSEHGIKRCHGKLLYDLSRVGVTYKFKYCAPRHDEVCKWLREEKNIVIIPTFSTIRKTFNYKIYTVINLEEIHTGDEFGSFITYEFAISKGITKAIQLLQTNTL